jgi:tetratricopeptide (TPR) repeat protein
LIGLSRTQLNRFQNAWVPWWEKEAALQRAENTIERLVKLAPRDVVSRYLRGSLLRSRRHPDSAIAAFAYALVFNSTYALAIAEIGRAKIDAGRARETIDHIESAIQLNPTDPHLHIWLGERSPGAQISRASPVPLKRTGARKGGLPLLATLDVLKAVAIAGREG